MDNIFQDIKYGFRSLKSKPGVTLIAVLAIALGIGANTALFSILYSVLWKPLPLKNPHELVMVWETSSETTSRNRDRNVINLGNFLDWKAQNKVFQDMAAFYGFSGNLSGDEDPEELPVQYTTHNFFKVLGVQAVLGRTFLPEDGKDRDAQVLVLTHGLWMRRYGGDPKIIREKVYLNGRPATIVGVLPRDFQWYIRHSSMIRKPPQLFAAFYINEDMSDRKGRFASCVARLKTGTKVEEAQSNMALIAKQIESQYYDFAAGWGIAVIPLREELSGELKKPLWILAGAVCFVLLIACTNVANLMLSRALSRSREIAVRAALGAERGRIIRQLLTESLLLSFTGGVIGIFFAIWGTQAFKLLGQRAGIDFESMQFNFPILAFTFIVSVLSGLIFGIIPALTASKWNLNDQLKEGSRGTVGVHGGKLRGVLVSVQIAVAVVLLSGAALLIQSFARLTSVDPGFDADHVLTFRVLIPSVKYREPAQRIQFFRSAIEEIQNSPGVKSAGMVSFLPFGGPSSATNFLIQGRPKPRPDEEPTTRVFMVDDGFFKTLQIPLIRGRHFSHSEMVEAKHVVLINEALANKYFPNEDPIGKKLAINMGDDIPYSDVIGIVGDVKHETLIDEAEPSIYWPHPELPMSFMTMVVRTENDPMSFASSAVAIIRRLDADQPVADIRKLTDWLGDSTARSKFSVALLGILALVALSLAIAGIYGVMSYAVLQRTQEMGIRMALGASRTDVFKLVLKEGSMLTIAGLVAGTAITIALTRLMKSMLYETSTTDPVAFAAVILVLIITALAACWLPSRRASRVNPLIALRYE